MKKLTSIHARFVVGLSGLCFASAYAGVAIDRTSGPVGIFQLDDGRKLYLSPLVDENGATLQFALSDGLQGRAQKTNTDEFADKAECPNSLRIVNTDTVEYTECKRSLKAKLIESVEEHPLALTAGDGQVLGASIWQSKLHQSRKGIVLAHGADDETRQMGVIIPQLIEAGFQVFTFDQRGTGVSGGSWRADGIAQISADMALAARAMQGRAGVESVGFFGFSNGGWVAPAAAVNFGTPAFLLIKSGDSGTVEQNVLFETSKAVAMNAGPANARRAQDVMQSLFTALHSDKDTDWDIARQRLQGVQDQSWLKYTQLPAPSAFPLPATAKEAFRRQLFFDPRKDLQQLQCPILVMLGEFDVDVDGPRSARLYRKYFRASGNKRTQVMLFKTAGHQLVKGPGSAANNSMATGQYVEGYPREMLTWLKSLGTDTQ